MEHLVATMLVWASYLSGYPLPDVDPHVVLETPQWFAEHACHYKDVTKDCKYVGLYTYNDHTIHIDNTLEDEDRDQIIFHEIIHYMQDVHGKWTVGTCADKLKREHEAYAVEQRYITEVQHSKAKVSPPTDKEICAN